MAKLALLVYGSPGIPASFSPSSFFQSPHRCIYQTSIGCLEFSQGLCTLRRLEKSSGLRDLHSGPEVWLGSFFVFQRTGCCLTESESDSVVSNSL